MVSAKRMTFFGPCVGRGQHQIAVQPIHRQLLQQIRRQLRVKEVDMQRSRAAGRRLLDFSDWPNDVVTPWATGFIAANEVGERIDRGAVEVGSVMVGIDLGIEAWKGPSEPWISDRMKACAYRRPSR